MRCDVIAEGVDAKRYKKWASKVPLVVRLEGTKGRRRQEDLINERATVDVVSPPTTWMTPPQKIVKAVKG